MLKDSRKIISNAAWIIGCKIVKAILTLLVTMLTARYLGVANYGLIDYARGIVAFVAPIMGLGLNSVAVHEIVNYPEAEGETVGSIITMCLASSLFCILGVFCFALLANSDEPITIAVCVIYGVTLIFQAIEMLQYWFQAKLLSKYSALAMLVSYIAVSIIQTLLLIHHADIRFFALSYSVDFLVIAIILVIVYGRIGKQKMTFSMKRSKELLSVSKFYIISALMITIFNNTDRIMLKLMVGDTATGIYAAAHTCASMTSFIFVAIIDSMRGTIFESRNESISKFEANMTGLYSVIIYFSLIQCFAVTILAPVIIRIMYGVTYVDSVSVLRIAVWFSTFSYLGTVRDIWLLSEGLQSLLWKINLSGAVMNVLLNSLLIPLWGPSGAAVTSVISQLFTEVITGFIIKRIRKNNMLMLAGANPSTLKTIVNKVLRQNKR